MITKCAVWTFIYGRKQSSRQWNIKFRQGIISVGFDMMEEEHCMCVKGSKEYFVVLSYIDDILLAETSGRC